MENNDFKQRILNLEDRVSQLENKVYSTSDWQNWGYVPKEWFNDWGTLCTAPRNPSNSFLIQFRFIEEMIMYQAIINERTYPLVVKRNVGVTDSGIKYNFTHFALADHRYWFELPITKEELMSGDTFHNEDTGSR